VKYLVFSALEYTISLSAKQKNLRKQSDLDNQQLTHVIMKQWGVDYIAQTSENVSHQSEWTGWTVESSDGAEPLSLRDWGETLQIGPEGCHELPQPASFHLAPPERPPQDHLKRVKGHSDKNDSINLNTLRQNAYKERTCM